MAWLPVKQRLDVGVDLCLGHAVELGDVLVTIPFVGVVGDLFAYDTIF